MIHLKINDRKLGKILQTSITYAEKQAGKIVENCLRNVVTGKQAKGLSATGGLYQQALELAPSKGEIDSKVRKLKSAFIFINGRKVKSRMSPKKTEDLIIARAKTIGHTARTLAYSGWTEADSARTATIPPDIATSHAVTIQTEGKKPKAQRRQDPRR